jgi:hypothetical protein
MINYRFDKYTPDGYKFVFDDNRYTIINLAKNYKLYREPCGRTCDLKWHYVVINVDNIYEEYHKNKLKIGDVVYLKKINNYPHFSSKGVDFRKATQSEFDYYEYMNNFDTDNAKVYCAIKNLFKRNIRETTL